MQLIFKHFLSSSRARLSALACSLAACLTMLSFLAGFDASAGLLRDHPSVQNCQVTKLLTDLFLIHNKGEGFKILPSIAGAGENIPRSLPRIPENRILFGIEAEFSEQEGMGQLKNAGNKGAQKFMQFYRESAESTKPGSFNDQNLYRVSSNAVDTWSPSAKALLEYLPLTTKRETGKVATHEVVSDILPNQATFRHVLRGIDREMGTGSFQGMISIPRTAVVAMGQTEMEGLLTITNELSTLSAIDKPRAFHPLLHPYNPPMGNYEGLNRGVHFRLELAKFFDQPNVKTSLSAGNLSNSKYTLGAAARFDLSDRYAGKSRFFIELRGCKENPDCIEKLASQLTQVFENEERGFAEFGKLELLTGGNLSPWKFGSAWNGLGINERQEIKTSLLKVFSLHPTISQIGQHFLYPLKGWDTLKLANGFKTETLLKAQNAYIEQLKRISPSQTYEEAMTVLSPALQNFSHDSGLLEYFKGSWKRITGREWDVQF
ncbi:MAG: hypothetical protein H7333_09985 [Bdellovibrionales bacterium]|nr:hypothetical protein [Oligoflexia bacterium]